MSQATAPAPTDMKAEEGWVPQQSAPRGSSTSPGHKLALLIRAGRTKGMVLLGVQRQCQGRHFWRAKS